MLRGRLKKYSSDNVPCRGRMCEYSWKQKRYQVVREKKAKSGPGNKNRSSLLFMFVDICGKQDTRYIWLGGVRMSTFSKLKWVAF